MPLSLNPSLFIESCEKKTNLLWTAFMASIFSTWWRNIVHTAWSSNNHPDSKISKVSCQYETAYLQLHGKSSVEFPSQRPNVHSGQFYVEDPIIDQSVWVVIYHCDGCFISSYWIAHKWQYNVSCSQPNSTCVDELPYLKGLLSHLLIIPNS